MFKRKARLLSFILVLCLTVSLFAGIGAVSLAAGAENTGLRHELCTELSSQAKAYYKGEYSWDSMSELEGVTTDSSLKAMNGELYGELQALMDDTMTNSVTYKSLTSYWQDTDASGGSNNAVLFYSDTVSSDYNREHVWPKSRGSFYQKNAGSDLHHLRPTNSTVNSTRGNLTMGDVVGVLSSYSTASYGGKTVLYYNSSLDLVEVNDDITGDVARILLYVYVRWGQPNLCENVSSANLPRFDSDDSDNNGRAVMEDLDTLLTWCAEDPVDTWEMSRNDCVQSIQGNRNVFIDYPEYAWLIFGREIPADMDTPSGEGENVLHYNITADANSSAYGSVSVSGNTVSAVPAEGCVVSRAEVSPAGSAVITRNGNDFILRDVKSDCNVKVIFEKAAEVTVSFSAPCSIAPIKTFAGSSVILPDCKAEVGKLSFLGWSESAVAGTDKAPAYFEAGSAYTPVADTVLYALYSLVVPGVQGGSGSNAELVTSAPHDWSGKYVIGVASKGIMMTSLNQGKTFLDYEDADFDGNAITNAAKGNIFTFTKVGNYYTIQDSSGAFLKCSGAKNISLDSSKSSVGSSDTAYLWTIGVNSISPATASYGKLQYNAAAPRFTTYTSSQTAIGIYRLGSADIVRYETVSGTVNPFDDVFEGTPYYEAILWAYYHQPKQITSGYTATEFRPYNNCSRGQVVTFLWHAAGNPAPKSDVCPFVDVEADTPYRTAIIWAAELGIIKGFDSTHFAPYDSVTRAQFVTLLWRYLGSPDTQISENPFVDVNEESVFYPAILWAAESGVTVGYGNDDFRPDMVCTRWQVVLFLSRAVD